MGTKKYAIGIDYGTESGRAVLVDVADGSIVAMAVHPYANGVIDETLPETGQRLNPIGPFRTPTITLRSSNAPSPPSCRRVALILPMSLAWASISRLAPSSLPKPMARPSAPS